MQPLAFTLNYGLVAVSVILSIVASYAAFSFGERIAKSEGSIFVAWLLSGTVAMGLGIWSMHYLGMLAVRLPVEVWYHVPTVLWSLLMAMLASSSVLLVVSQPRPRHSQIAAGSLIMGSGIGAMHYTGMHAMRSSAMHRYQPLLVLLSVVVAISFSWGALWIAFAMRSDKQRQELFRIGGATVMGIGIAAMHYTAMTAVSFVPDAMQFSTVDTVKLSTLGIVAVVITTTMVLLGALATAVVDRRYYDQLSKERDCLHAAAECSLDCLYLCEAVRDERGEIRDFTFSYLNTNVEKVSELPLRFMLGGSMRAVLPKVPSLGNLELYKRVVHTGEPSVAEFSFDYGGKISWVRIQAVKLRDGVAITASDITARKRDEEHIKYLAHHDPLTGLVNRSLLQDRIEQGMERARRSGALVGVFLIDLDSFKQINDSLGHSAGDTVLVSVAHRLQTMTRAVDSVIRIGGDEFVVVTPEMNAWSDIERCALKLIDAFRTEIWFDGRSLAVTCSVGAALYPDSARTADELLAEADAAMYAAKRRGKNQCEISRPKVLAELQAKI